MLSLLLSLSAVAPAQPATGHEAVNPLYKSLLDPGLVVGPDARVKLPAPLMPDGLDAAAQKAIITKLIAEDYDYDTFTRKSQVAPLVLRINDLKAANAREPVRGLDTYFVAYVDLKAFDDETFLDRSLNVGKGEGGKGKAITKDDLARRGITVVDEKREGYGQIEFDFLEKVRLKLTGHAMSSKTAGSVVAAADVDPRFTNDKEFPNQWQSLSKESGTLAAGPPQPYGGAGMYIKITKLAEPAGAVFVEQHVVFVEPQGWFNGANLLRSKLPPVTTVNVRRMREAWMKGK
jgi:hypothetical protein